MYSAHTHRHTYTHVTNTIKVKQDINRECVYMGDVQMRTDRRDWREKRKERNGVILPHEKYFLNKENKIVTQFYSTEN